MLKSIGLFNIQRFLEIYGFCWGEVASEEILVPGSAKWKVPLYSLHDSLLSKICDQSSAWIERPLLQTTILVTGTEMGVAWIRKEHRLKRWEDQAPIAMQNTTSYFHLVRLFANIREIKGMGAVDFRNQKHCEWIDREEMVRGYNLMI